MSGLKTAVLRHVQAERVPGVDRRAIWRRAPGGDRDVQ
jgi:hypothetical protein